jgi:hypothetical protein
VLSLVALVVGFLVGFAVKKGSNGRGGPPYQWLAVFLTYTAIAISEALWAPGVTRAAGLVDAVVELYARPIVGGGSVIGLVIVAVGLYEAWAVNKPASLAITGPFDVGAGPAPAPPR